MADDNTGAPAPAGPAPAPAPAGLGSILTQPAGPAPAPAPEGITPAPAPGPQPAPAPAPNLFEGYEADDVEWIKAKGYDKLQDHAQIARAALKGHRNAERLIGTDKGDMLIVPKGEEDWGKVYDKLGRPAKPEEYKIESEMSDDFKAWAPQTFHELGLNQKQANALVEKYNALTAAAQEKAAEKHSNDVKQQVQALSDEWGARHDTNMAQTKAVVAKLGIPAEAVDGIESRIGYAATVKLFHGLASKLGEAKFVTPDASDGQDLPMTPDQAKRELRVFQANVDNLAVMQDKFHPDRESRTKRFKQLTAWANSRAM